MKTRVRTSQRLWTGIAGALILSLLIAACNTAAPPSVTEEATNPPEAVPTEPPTAVPTPTPTLTPEPSRPLSGLAADPQRVEFQASDGKKLVGYYYPSKYADAPVVILMHWAGGDLCDWSAIAPWLQNRANENPPQIERCVGSTGESLRSDLPPIAAEVSFAVFAFDFRGYGESEAGGERTKLAQDALAAFQTAAGFEGVDATRLAAIGASIGADGAADGCLLHNQAGGGCVGALSLSPGNYLGMNYSTVVADIDPVPVWCLAGEQDSEAAPTCASASGDHYRSQIYPGTRDHGMMLLIAKLDPPVLGLIQDFLELVFGEPMK